MGFFKPPQPTLPTPTQQLQGKDTAEPMQAPTTGRKEGAEDNPGNLSLSNNHHRRLIMSFHYSRHLNPSIGPLMIISIKNAPVPSNRRVYISTNVPIRHN